MPPIFHITHIDNLASILAAGCLWCDSERRKQQLQSVGIAHEHIKQRRENRIVPTCQGGVLADYVPFYFGPRSPMLYVIYRGGVQGYAGGQSRVLHLASSTDRVIQSQLPYTFTNGHAEMATARFYEDPNDFDEIDLQLMRETRWNDTRTDGNRKWRRQAEFLVHRSFPFALIEEIGVISQRLEEEVHQTLNATGIQLNVTVRPEWYYR